MLLKDLNNVDNFIDDILEHTVDWCDHMTRLRELLQRLREAGLTARPTKCMIAFTSVGFLGHNVGDGLLTPNEDKVRGIVEAKHPETKKQVQSFLGMGMGFIVDLYPSLQRLPFLLRIWSGRELQTS